MNPWACVRSCTFSISSLFNITIIYLYSLTLFYLCKVGVMVSGAFLQKHMQTPIEDHNNASAYALMQAASLGVHSCGRLILFAEHRCSL